MGVKEDGGGSIRGCGLVGSMRLHRAVFKQASGFCERNCFFVNRKAEKTMPLGMSISAGRVQLMGEPVLRTLPPFESSLSP